MVTISGGVVSKENNTSVTFRLKCDKCGHMDESESTITVTLGLTEVTTKNCPSCGHRQIIKMKMNLN